jgi:hypothetical protein
MMQTFDEMHERCMASGHPCAYWGKRGHWYVGLGRHRDSDALEEANFRALLKALGGESAAAVIERETHWAVGWVEFILIDPTDAVRLGIADDIKSGLEDYPVVDDEIFSQVEHDRFWSWAESELGGHEKWAAAVDELDRNGNYFIGDESSEWALIETARTVLEAKACAAMAAIAAATRFVRGPIDSRQMRTIALRQGKNLM